MSPQTEIFAYDKRFSLRVLSNVKATVYLKKGNITKKTGISAAVYDISENGSLLRLKNPLALTEDVFIKFIFSFPFKEVVIKSKIIWSHKDKNLYGVNFLNLTQDQALFLEEYINRHTGTRKIKLDRRRTERRASSEKPSTIINDIRKQERRHLVKHIKKPKYFSNTLDEYIKDLTDFDYIEELDTTTTSLKLPIKQFDLLINNKHVNTGRYEYFPYTEKVITDFDATRTVIQELKKGVIPRNPEQYVFARYTVGTSDTNLKAIESASQAFKIFSKMPLVKRKKILEDIHTLLIKNKDTLIDLMVIEGHPKKLAEWEFSGMELAYCKENLDFFKNEIIKEVGRTDQEKLYLVRKPDGVLCVNPPKNAPCSSALIAGFALLTGNTLIIKPPLRSPISSIYLWDKIVNSAVKANGGPDGTVNIIVGNSKKILEEWLESTSVRCILHFGDSKTGIEIGERIYKAGKKPILELSGNDYMVVWKDADLDKASDALLDSFLGSTQICMVPKKAIIHPYVYNQFKDSFIKKTAILKAGFPSDEHVLLSPVGKIKELFQFLEDALNKGAKLLIGGFRINELGEKDDKGIFVAPTLVEVDYEQCKTMLCIKEENFFPLLPLIRLKPDSDEIIYSKIINLINSNNYGLRTSVWVKDEQYISRFSEDINTSGFIRINSNHAGFSPFLSTHGGPGLSGGPFGEMNYMWQKTSKLQGISITKPS